MKTICSPIFLFAITNALILHLAPGLVRNCCEQLLSIANGTNVYSNVRCAGWSERSPDVGVVG